MDDDLLTLPDTAEIGLVHALELPAADAATFGQIFADYEILQPFAQIGREVYRLTDEERAATALTLTGAAGPGWRMLRGRVRLIGHRRELRAAGHGRPVRPSPCVSAPCHSRIWAGPPRTGSAWASCSG